MTAKGETLETASPRIRVKAIVQDSGLELATLAG